MAGAVLTLVTGLRLADPGVISAKPAAIEMSAEQAGPRWTLSWNPASLNRAHPVYLTIADGLERRRYALTPEQVRAGSVGYAPSTERLAFSLEAAGGVIETLIVVHHRPKRK